MRWHIQDYLSIKHHLLWWYLKDFSILNTLEWYVHLKRIEFGAGDNIFFYFFSFLHIQFNVNPFKNPQQSLFLIIGSYFIIIIIIIIKF